MDSNIIEALTYAEDMARNIREDYEHGKATEKEAVIRMFHLGKCLLGWDQDDERSDVEIIQSLLAMNRIVTEAIDESAKKWPHERKSTLAKTNKSTAENTAVRKDAGSAFTSMMNIF